VAAELFKRELGDKIRVFVRRPVAVPGSSRTSMFQKIDIGGVNDARPGR
jgi:hypothetical protein